MLIIRSVSDGVFSEIFSFFMIQVNLYIYLYMRVLLQLTSFLTSKYPSSLMFAMFSLLERVYFHPVHDRMSEMVLF
jgi:hypothetical protein